MADLPSAWRLAGILGPCCCAAGLMAGGSIAPGNDTPQAHGIVPQGDSQAVLASLRRAQTEFELVRLRHLPRVLGGSRSTPDAVFGRIRYWDEDAGAVQQRPPEHQSVVRARSILLAQLDSAAARFPGDDWITGQLVRYLVDAGRLRDARQVTDACQAAPWWCAALSGFVAHLEADFEISESQFAISLGLMAAEQRCEWTDLREVLDLDVARTYRRVRCDDRDSLNARLFWLADPLYSVSGNDRRTEHFARHVVHHMFDGTTTPQGDRWNEDNLSLIRRYGWSETWEQTGFSHARGLPHVIGLHWRRGEHFIPSRTTLDQTADVDWDDWDIDPDRPRERYAPRYVIEFAVPDGQVAVFRRTSGNLVVAAFQVPAPSRDQGDSETRRAGQSYEAEVAIVAAQDPQSGRLMVADTIDSPEARLALQVPALPVLLSIEALNRRDSIAARRRYWLETPRAPPDSFGVSDLLLIDSHNRLPLSLDDAFPLARTMTTFSRGDSIDVFWEVYGAAGLEVRAVSVTVIKEGRGFFRRAAEWIGLAERDKPTTRLEWIDAPDMLSDGPGNAVTLQLPEDQEGGFTIRLEVTSADGERAVAEREIMVGGTSETR